MDINLLLNEKVTHKIFGKGVIIEIEGEYLVVFFEKKDKRCRFLYPSSFRDFISIDNDKLKDAIEEDLNEWLISSGTLEKEKTRELTMITQKGIEKRRIRREKARIERAKEIENRLKSSMLYSKR